MNNPEFAFCKESISTCRFAQRVALIKNEALINEELDPKLIINRLKKEVEELKNQLSISSNGMEMAGELSAGEYDKLRFLVQTYLDDRDVDSALSVGADMRKINFCFNYFKEMYTQLRNSGALNASKAVSSSNNQAASIQIVDSSHYDSKEMKDLKETLRQRDNEISILVNMLKKEKKKTSDFSNG
jgi:kinesin family protein 6/9